MAQYLPIGILLIIGVLFGAGSFLASGLLGPRRPHRAKAAPYECGIVPRVDPPERFPVRFYLVAMIFIIFDIEIVFLYPYAAAAGSLGTFGVIEVAGFAVVVFVAFAYLVSNGALDWVPRRRVRAHPPEVQRSLEAPARAGSR